MGSSKWVLSFVPALILVLATSLGAQEREGPAGYYVVSDGKLNPYRVKVKSPCFTAMSVFHHLARGMMIADIVALIGSLDIVLGEIDR